MMSKKTRTEKRLQKNCLVSFSTKGFESMGLTANLSSTGLMVMTSRKLSPEQEIALLLGSADDTFFLKGQVIWSRNSFTDDEGNPQYGSGIRLMDIPDKYRIFVHSSLQTTH